MDEKHLGQKRTGERRNERLYGQQTEARILGQIVEAMLEAAGDLQGASLDDWGMILIDSCRRQKRCREMAVVAGCC
jgi:hypothetical protein